MDCRRSSETVTLTPKHYSSLGKVAQPKRICSLFTFLLASVLFCCCWQFYPFYIGPENSFIKVKAFAKFAEFNLRSQFQ